MSRTRRYSPYDIALQADQLLRTLARDHVLVSRRMGQGLAHMAQAGHFAALGYSCLENYATQRLGISGRSAQELAWIERRLPGYPAIDQAYERGAITFSHARRLLQARIPVEEDRAWAERAASLSIAQLEEAIEEWKASGRPAAEAPQGEDSYPFHEPSEEEHPVHAIKCHVSPTVFLKFELAVEVARRMHGADLPVGALLESMMAEYISGAGGVILAALDEVEDDEDEVPGATLPWRRRRSDLAQVRRDLDASLAEITLHWQHLNWEVPSLPAHPQAEAAEAVDMDRHMYAIARYSNARDAELMKLLAMVADDRLYDLLEFSSLQQYAAERLAMSPRTAWALVSLQRRVRRLPVVLQAFRDRLINRAQADLISQVAVSQTQQAWIGHARATTVKCLRQDVQDARRRRDLDPDTYLEEGVLPPGQVTLQACALSSQTMAEALRVQACAPTTGEELVGRGRLQTCALPGDEDEEADLSAAEVSRHGVRERLRMFGRGQLDDVRNDTVITVRFHLPNHLVGMWRDVYRACQSVLGNMATVADCLEVCADAFLTTWAPDALRSIRDHLVLERDGWVCANPTCTRRAQLHDHHLQYRSAGGSDLPENRLTLCRFCHLRLVHENRIRVKGTAPQDLMWELGLGQSTPHLMVVCRRVVGGTACDIADEVAPRAS